MMPEHIQLIAEQEKYAGFMSAMGEAAGRLRQELWDKCVSSMTPLGAPPPSSPSPDTPLGPLTPSPIGYSSAVGSLPRSSLRSLEDSLRGIRSHVYLLAKTYLGVNPEGKNYHKLLDDLESFAGYSS